MSKRLVFLCLAAFVVLMPVFAVAEDDFGLPPPPDANEDLLPPPPGEAMGDEMPPPPGEMSGGDELPPPPGEDTGDLPPPPSDEASSDLPPPPAEESGDELPPPPAEEASSDDMPPPPAEEASSDDMPPPPAEEEVAAPMEEEAAAPAPEEEEPVKVTKKSSKSAESGTSKYKVAKGDSLWRISGSSKGYDDSFLWPLIFKSNRATIEDPDLIEPRQVLKISKNYSEAEMEDAASKAKETPPYEPHTSPRKSLPIKY